MWGSRVPETPPSDRPPIHPWTNCTGPHSTLTRVSIATIVQFPTAWSKNPYAMSSHGEGSGPAAAPSGYSYFVRQSEDQWTTA